MSYIYCNCTESYPVGRESIHLEALKHGHTFLMFFFASKFFSLAKARETFSLSVFTFSPLGGKFILNQLLLFRWLYFSYGTVSTLKNSKAYRCGRVLEENRCLREASIPERGDRGKWYLHPEGNKIHLLSEKAEKRYGKEITESEDKRLLKTFSQEDCSC